MYLSNQAFHPIVMAIFIEFLWFLSAVSHLLTCASSRPIEMTNGCIRQAFNYKIFIKSNIHSTWRNVALGQHENDNDQPFHTIFMANMCKDCTIHLLQPAIDRLHLLIYNGWMTLPDYCWTSPN